MLAHALGYVSEVSSDELKTAEYKSYAPGDPVGKFGLERMYEQRSEGHRRGKKGRRWMLPQERFACSA